MIDVSTLRGPCPRCTGRRVWRVSVPTDEWSCIPNPIPFPFKPSHMRVHDATETQELGQVPNMNNTNTKTQRPRGAGNGR